MTTIDCTPAPEPIDYATLHVDDAWEWRDMLARVENEKRLQQYRERLLSATPDQVHAAPHAAKKFTAATLYAVGRDWPHREIRA